MAGQAAYLSPMLSRFVAPEMPRRPCSSAMREERNNTCSISACGLPRQTSRRAAQWCQRPPARRRRSARTALTSRSISSTDIGSMRAAATRSAIAKSASAACRRLIASVSGRSSASDVKGPASRAALAVASAARSEPSSCSLRQNQARDYAARRALIRSASSGVRCWRAIFRS